MAVMSMVSNGSSGAVLSGGGRLNGATLPTTEPDRRVVLYEFDPAREAFVLADESQSGLRQFNTLADESLETSANRASVVDETNLFPAANFVYALTGDQNLRFGVSQTVNRPEFRELAPFEFTDKVLRFGQRVVQILGSPR